MPLPPQRRRRQTVQVDGGISGARWHAVDRVESSSTDRIPIHASGGGRRGPRRHTTSNESSHAGCEGEGEDMPSFQSSNFGAYDGSSRRASSSSRLSRGETSGYGASRSMVVRRSGDDGNAPPPRRLSRSMVIQSGDDDGNRLPRGLSSEFVDVDIGHVRRPTVSRNENGAYPDDNGESSTRGGMGGTTSHHRQSTCTTPTSAREDEVKSGGIVGGRYGEFVKIGLASFGLVMLGVIITVLVMRSGGRNEDPVAKQNDDAVVTDAVSAQLYLLGGRSNSSHAPHHHFH